MVKIELFTKNFICTFNFRLFYKHRINLEEKEKEEECIGHLISYIFEERAGGEIKKMEIMVLYVILNETQSLLATYLSKKKKKDTVFWKTKLPNIYFCFYSNHHFLLLSVSQCQYFRVSLIFVTGSLLFESVHFTIGLLQF